MSTTSPRTADAIARPSHHDDFLNRPQVAIVKPSSVMKARTCVMDHKMPLVEMPRPTNIGVNHRYVVPKRNSATPPKLRIVSMAFTSITNVLRESCHPEGSLVHSNRGIRHKGPAQGDRSQCGRLENHSRSFDIFDWW